MSMREQNLSAMRDILAGLSEALDVIHVEIEKCQARVKHMKHGLTVEEQIGTIVTTLDPLAAPEIVGADKDGNGGMAFVLDESDGEG